jgi:hypothetical protein
LIAGGTGTGKTTLLNALAAQIPDTERIVVIEETAEIHLAKPNLLRCEARRAQIPFGQEVPLPAVTITDLLRATLRHRPDRILLGEVRGAEAFDLLQALNTGHWGSLSTIHANSAEQALTRLAHCVLTANDGLPHHSIREAIALAIHLVASSSRSPVAAGTGASPRSCACAATRHATTGSSSKRRRPTTWASAEARRDLGHPPDRSVRRGRSPALDSASSTRTRHMAMRVIQFAPDRPRQVRTFGPPRVDA